MRSFAVYLRLQLKRALRLLPRMLALTLLLAALASLSTLLLSGLREGDEARVPVRVGIVGDLEEGMLGEAIGLLETLDSSRYSLRLEPMTEAEAASALRSGRIAGYARVPEGFAEAMMIGEHRPIVFVTLNGGADVGAQMLREIAGTASALVLETENAVYGAQDAVAELTPGRNPYDAGDRLVLRYMLRIMDRERLFELETVGAAGSLSLPGYYLCGLSVLFLLLWSLSCTPYASGRSRELSGLLAGRGLPCAAQLGAEYLGCVLLMLGGLLAGGTAAGLLLRRFGAEIPELAGLGAGRLFVLGLRALPVALMLCALQLLLFELTESVVAGVLLQFLNAALQGYLAGCFYPSAFFPDALRRFGAVLPAGVALRALQALLLGGDAGVFAAVWAFLLLFLLAAALLRERRARA